MHLQDRTRHFIVTTMKHASLQSTPPKTRGRPLSFDRDQAVQRAMLLFWQHGYEATSLSQLTAALGVPPSSIYTAFGDKKGLFLAAVQRYVTGGPVSASSIIQGAASARKAAQSLLREAAIGYTAAGTPRGCLLASSAISCSPVASDVQQVLARIRRGIQRELRDKLRQGRQRAELPADTDVDALAAHTMAVIQGMSTLARDGASRAALLRVAEQAMSCWPEPNPAGDSAAGKVPAAQVVGRRRTRRTQAQETAPQ